MKKFVVIPAYNEEGKIGKAIKEIIKKAPFIDKIIVINDGSTDKTKEEILSIKNKKIVLLNHKKNKGVGGAHKTGFKYALKKGADIIIPMGGDGQTDPISLKKLISPIEKGEVDYAHGSRFLGIKAKKMPLIRLFGIKIYSWFFSLVTKIKITDYSSGYRAYSKEMFKKIKMPKVNRYTFEQELMFEAIKNKVKIKEVPVHIRYGKNTSKMKLKDMFQLWNPIINFIRCKK